MVPYRLVNDRLEKQISSFIDIQTSGERWYVLGFLLGVASVYSYDSPKYKNTMAFVARLEKIPTRYDKETRYEHLRRWRHQVLCNKR